MYTFYTIKSLLSFKFRADDEVSIYPTGLVIGQRSLWIAATPDGKVFCLSLNPPLELLEIKCFVNPLASRLRSPQRRRISASITRR